MLSHGTCLLSSCQPVSGLAEEAATFDLQGVTNALSCRLQGRAGPSSSSDSVAENAKEQARLWLQTGQTWLKTATAKVSKVTKEASAALQKGLEDLDSRFVQKGVPRPPWQGQCWSVLGA